MSVLLGTAYYGIRLGLRALSNVYYSTYCRSGWLAALIGLIHNQYQKFILDSLHFSAGGAASATRHLYLQSLPADQVPTCGPDLAYLIDKSYFADALSMLFMVMAIVLKFYGVCWEFLFQVGF